MNTIRNLLPIIKIALLVGLCLYTVLSSLLFIYLQIHFFDPTFFPKVIVQIVAVNTVFLLNLFLSAKPLALPADNKLHSASDPVAAFVCSVIGCVIFLCLALRSHTLYDWFFALCTLPVVILSLSDLIHHGR